eukprot:763541-Hanusia_phi.AAC.4
MKLIPLVLLVTLSSETSRRMSRNSFLCWNSHSEHCKQSVGQCSANKTEANVLPITTRACLQQDKQNNSEK